MSGYTLDQVVAAHLQEPAIVGVLTTDESKRSSLRLGRSSQFTARKAHEVSEAINSRDVYHCRVSPKSAVVAIIKT
jgi:hypothetical protein